MKVREQGLGNAGVALLLLLGALAALALPQAASASSAKQCGSVVRGLSGLKTVGVSFYKAKVLVIQGDVPCSEARKMAYRGMYLSGFCAPYYIEGCGVKGWRCHTRGDIPTAIKCWKDNPRQVIKSSKPPILPLL